jgi:tyrosyl-tRNA synthetase
VVVVPSGPVHVPALLVDHLGIASRGEARRLIGQGGVTIDGERIVDLDVDAQLLADKVVRAGKRRFARIEVAG